MNMVESTTPVKMPQQTGSPLFPITPDRMNQQKMNISPTKSLDAMHSPTRSGRGASDVQAKVAFLNRLSSATTPERPVSHVSTTTAALQRAILGREEAESALQTALAQLSEANARERRVSERLESLVEELHSLKERQVHERTVFEKEVRKARKEAFRAGSALVKAQEELKFSRGEIKSLKEEVKLERDAKERAKQEAFERAYALAGLTEELETLKGKLRASETENNFESLEAQVEEIRGQTPAKNLAAPEAVLMSTSPGSRGIKRGQPDSTDNRSPSRKRSLNTRDRLSSKLGSPVKFSLDSTTSVGEDSMEVGLDEDDSCLIDKLNDDLQWEKRMRQKAEDMVHFLKMECQFKRCSCRLAENRGTRYVHDPSWDTLCQGTEKEPELKEARTKPQDIPALQGQPSPSIPTPPCEAHEEPEQQPDEPLVTFCSDTGTFQVIPSPNRNTDVNDGSMNASQTSFGPSSPSPTFAPQNIDIMGQTEEAQDLELASQSPDTEISIEIDQYRPSSNSPLETVPANRTGSHSLGPKLPFKTHPYQPSHLEYQTITTTRTIPLYAETQAARSEAAFCPIPATPINREEALAQIRARRDRTQGALKRSASANDANTKLGMMGNTITPMTGTKRIPRVENSGALEGHSMYLGSGIRGRRDISAPIASVRRNFR
ncbi:hypothetical protein D8B26_002814 [Coccidioides posadasii str. Silveira]|uniref:Uncharacterized protein n=1 Tax=Coccidioides posadasii (strain RMSCC 757 / Silveira) TaxID=443226 RepID=E9CY66_COCPS|nr:conserved hypothetical protein [Coccidioides posadasii str. Silveira]QVM08117.1 hypothetical protein D8B26_002814 [Coccidioides posadasii str. Silveira]